MKAHRRIAFAMGKFIKYSLWFSTALFFYHYYQVMFSEKPSEGMLVNDTMLNLAYFWKWLYEDIYNLLTKPPVDSLLMERPPAPPGAMYPKTLVMNLNGLLIHTEYKLGVGFEVLKRPGLTSFLGRMKREYELVLFSDCDRMVSANSDLTVRVANRGNCDGFGPKWYDFQWLYWPRGDNREGWKVHQRLFLLRPLSEGSDLS